MKKNVVFFLIFAQNIDCGYTLDVTNTHNLCFRAKKMYTHVKPSVGV